MLIRIARIGNDEIFKKKTILYFFRLLKIYKIIVKYNNNLNKFLKKYSVFLLLSTNYWNLEAIRNMISVK